METELPPEIALSNHALLLQGPAGPFMRRFAEDLMDAGIRVTKVNFHAGDVFFFSGPNSLPYRGDARDWPVWLRDLMRKEKVDALFLFGDRRHLHELAVAQARALGVRVWVFEEGYLRPDWITVEEHGVNGRSQLPRDPAFYRSRRETLSVHVDSRPIPPTSFAASAWYSALNALAFTLFNRGFPHYQHHRNLNAWYHTACWLRSAQRKLRFGRAERKVLPKLCGELSKRYFLVPLQVHCDFQLRYSRYSDVIDFVLDLVETFAEVADPDDRLVFKHHPMDRAFRDYTHFFARLRLRTGLHDRLIYVHDLELPTLLQHAKGTITINSTVGLQSLRQGVPTHCFGEAVYNFDGMTHRGSIAEFLREPGKVEHELVDRFCSWLLHHNQANGNYYAQVLDCRRGTGISWWPSPPEIAAQ